VNLSRLRSRLAEIFCKFGMKNIDAQILAELMIENQKLCACDIGKRLNYSLSGVTSSLHRLMRYRLVTREKSGRRYLYRADGHVLSALLYLMEEVERYDLKKLKKEIRKVSRLERYKEKLKELMERIENAEIQLKALIKGLRKIEEASL